MIYATPRTKRRIRLINPNSPLSTITMPDVIGKMTFFSRRKALFAPVGLAVCAAAVPDHWDVELIDECVLDKPHVPKPDCDIVGISAMTTQAKRAYVLADAYRALGVTVVLGGIHPSAMPEDALPHCDAVCKGDGETTLPHVIADWERGLAHASQQGTSSLHPQSTIDMRPEDPVAQASRLCSRPVENRSHMGNRSHMDGGATWASGRSLKRIYDWAELPPTRIGSPRKDLYRPEDYLVANPIQTTRGCPHTCTFCTTPGVFGHKYRRRLVSEIAEEIRQAKALHNSWCFIFADDNFAANQKWALDLCAELEKLNIAWATQCDILVSRNDKLMAAMRRSGCVGLILGLESRKQDTLDEAGKRFVKSDSYEWRIRKIQSHRISLWGAFIFGFDHDDWRDLMFTGRWAQKMNLAMSCYPILTPYPGTGIWEHFQKSGRLLTRDWDKYNGASVVFQPNRLTPAQLRHAQMAAFAEFFSMRSTVRRLRFWPMKKRAWLANLAVERGIRYYYGKYGRRIPRFSDFLDPAHPVCGRPVSDDATSPTREPPVTPAAEPVLAQADPLRQAAETLAVLNPHPAGSSTQKSHIRL